MDKYERKRLKTSQQLEVSFVSLISDKPVYKITVNEVCQRAGINRSTFYTHYENIDALLKKIERELVEEVEKAAALSNSNQIMDSEELLQTIGDIVRVCLKGLVSHKERYLALLSPNGDPSFKHSYMEIIRKSIMILLKEQKIEIYQDYLIHFYAYGSVNFLYEWLQREELSELQITDIIITHLRIILNAEKNKIFSINDIK